MMTALATFRVVPHLICLCISLSLANKIGGGISSNDDAKRVADVTATLDKRNADDLLPADTEHKDHSRGAKYFMYAHQPAKKQYEFGYKRGNDHHTIERYEKAGPKHNFKTKVRWHDAHGGHGEQYWDYNHVPKDEHDGGHKHPSDGHGHYSKPVPSFLGAESEGTPLSKSPSDQDPLHKIDENFNFRGSKLMKRSGIHKKLETEVTKKPAFMKKKSYRKQNKETTSDHDNKELPSVFPESLGFNPYVPPAFAQRNKANRQRATTSRQRNRYTENSSETPSKTVQQTTSSNKYRSKVNDKLLVPKLAYDLDTGRVYDENTDSWFKLVAL